MKLLTPRALAVGGAVVVIGGLLAVSQKAVHLDPADGSTATLESRVGFATDMAQGIPLAAAPPAVKAGGFTREVAANQSAPTFRQSAVAPTMIIRAASVTLQVDSIETAIAAVRRLATSMSGHIASMNTQTGQHDVRAASLVMKVPAARFDSAMTGIPALGKIESSSSSSEDVGEEFVDVNARVANAKRLENRLVTLLATRTGKLEEVLTVERELARVRQEIERYEGRIQFLGAQVAMSTIHVNVHEKMPIIATRPGTNVIGQAFVAMWRNAVKFVAVTIEVSGVLIPVALLAWAAFAVWRWVRRNQLVAG